MFLYVAVPLSVTFAHGKHIDLTRLDDTQSPEDGRQHSDTSINVTTASTTWRFRYHR
jgi:hypothetical protein